MNEAIRVEALRKSYGERTVLNGLTFSVQKGEIFALLGVNGAGKTTALAVCKMEPGKARHCYTCHSRY